MNILYYDIETSPILSYTWGTYQTDVLSIVTNTGLLCFSYKINKEKTVVISTRVSTEKRMVKMLWNLFDKADVIIGQNSDRFDNRVVNSLFIKYGLTPPSPYKTVDTLKIARKYFRFDSNKLDNLGAYLVGERKKSTGGIGLWLDCMNGDEKSLLKMERYCKQDVDLLVKVYEKLKGWTTNHPNHNLYHGTTHECPVCGKSTHKRGFMYTRTGKYQRYQCTNELCAAWSRGEKIKHDKVIT